MTTRNRFSTDIEDEKEAIPLMEDVRKQNYLRCHFRMEEGRKHKETINRLLATLVSPRDDALIVRFNALLPEIDKIVACAERLISTYRKNYPVEVLVWDKELP